MDIGICFSVRVCIVVVIPTVLFFIYLFIYLFLFIFFFRFFFFFRSENRCTTIAYLYISEITAFKYAFGMTICI